MSELQVSLEVTERDRITAIIWLTVNGQRMFHLSTVYLDAGGDPEELADEWRVALRNIDGPEAFKQAGKLEWCLFHGQVLQSSDECAQDYNNCRSVPLFFRDIKDKADE